MKKNKKGKKHIGSVGKTNKSYKKRLKVTKRGKVLARKAGGNHFNAKESREDQLKRGTPRELEIKDKSLNRFLPKEK